jgi:hypothetical protein
MLYFLLMMGGAIAFFYLYSTRTDEISRLMTGLLCLLCFLVSLIYAPWLVKSIAILAIVLLFPQYQRSVF